MMISTDPKYTFGCLSKYIYTLTIPAENMTEYEQGSVWRCEDFGYSRVKSSDVTLKISSKSQDMEPSKLIKFSFFLISEFLLFENFHILNFFSKTKKMCSNKRSCLFRLKKLNYFFYQK